MHTQQKIINTTLVALAATPAFAEGEFDIGYNTKYVSEGRNHLVDSGINWLNGSVNINDNISVVAAYGLPSNSDVDYDEFNLAIEYGFSSGDFAYYIAYTRLEFFKDDESDNEIGVGVAWNSNEIFTSFADFVYATEAEGAKLFYQLKEDLAISAFIQLDMSSTDIERNLGIKGNQIWSGVHLTFTY